MKLRIVSALLTLLIAAPCLFSCASTSSGSSESKASSTTAGSDTAEATTALTDGLPDTDMDGFSLNILHFNEEWLTWAETTLDVEELTGDMLDDAIYNRNRTVEERFDCTLNISGAKTIEAKDVSSLAMSGDSSYDVVYCYDLWLLGMIEYLMPWNDIPYINFDADWWNPDASDIFTFAGDIYSPAGNFSLAVLSRCAGFVFNKVIYEELGLDEDLYATVSDGKWTIDKLYEIGDAAVKDLNGDGAYTADDRFGMLGSYKEYYSRLIQGSGIRYITKDSDGYPRFTLPSDSEAIDKMQHILDLNAGSLAYYNDATGIDSGSSVPANFFQNRHVLFTTASILSVVNLRDMEDDIGILPTPKYDEAQEQYYSPSFGSEVPILLKTFDMSRAENMGMILEALTFSSEQELIPMYKEVLLKTKYARDEGSEAMLDIIFGGIEFEFGINAWQDSVARPIITDVFFKNPGKLVSKLESMSKSVDSDIEKLIAKLDANKEG